jgi:uncharacterized protein YcfJ
MRIIASGPKVDHKLTYRDISFQRVEVGKLPNDLFLPTQQTPPLSSLTLTRSVFVDQPETVGGAPNVRQVSEHFQGQVSSPWTLGVAGGAIGGIVGAVVGAFPAILTGNGAWLAAGAILGAAGGGFSGATAAANREMQLSIEEKAILQKTMTGIDTVVSPGTLKGNQGFFHRFEPQLQSSNLGNYDVPSLDIVKKDSK